MCLIRNTLADLYQTFIHFDAVDFNECHSTVCVSFDAQCMLNIKESVLSRKWGLPDRLHASRCRAVMDESTLMARDMAGMLCSVQHVLRASKVCRQGVWGMRREYYRQLLLHYVQYYTPRGSLADFGTHAHHSITKLDPKWCHLYFKIPPIDGVKCTSETEKVPLTVSQIQWDQNKKVFLCYKLLEVNWGGNPFFSKMSSMQLWNKLLPLFEFFWHAWVLQNFLSDPLDYIVYWM